MISIPQDFFSPTELKLFVILRDGQPHPTRELVEALKDIAADKGNLSDHIVKMRFKLLRDYDLNILHKVEGKRVSYVLARTAVVRMEGE